MAWVELVPLGAILLLAAWIFLRPYPGDKNDDSDDDPDRP